MSSDPQLLLGIDIGGTKTAIIVGHPEKGIVERTQIASGAERGAEIMLADIEVEMAATLVRHPGVGAIGVSVGGPVDAEAGMVLGPPNLRFGDRFRLPTRIEHDAKACAFAEWRYGAGRGTRNMVFLTLGTGLGAGIIANGAILRGAGNLAGEIGHWRIAADGPLIYGKRGSLEGWASGAGLPALARFLDPVRFDDVADAAVLAAQAASCDRAAMAVIEQSANALGQGLALLIDLLAPEVIVLGNLARRLGPMFLEAATARATEEALPALAGRSRIVCCELGEGIGDMAALAIAAEAVGVLKD